MLYEITDVHLSEYSRQLHNEEKSLHTIQKYLRDVRAFRTYARNSFAGKEAVLHWKEHLGQSYRPRSANSMLASLNHFFPG